MQKSYLLLHLDTLNGKAPFCTDLNLDRNTSYLMIMKLDGSTFHKTADDETIGGVKEVARITNPKRVDSIEKLLALANSEIKDKDSEKSEK